MNFPMHFTPFEVTVLAAGYLWWLSLGITLIVLVVALTRPAGRRRLWFCLAALLPSFYLVLALGVAFEVGYPQWRARQLNRAQRPIAAPRQLHGAWLPAGSRIYWTNPEQDDFSSIDLPGPSRIFGLPLTGSLTYPPDDTTDDMQRFWQGTLAVPATVSGWPCTAGPVQVNDTGALHSCTLAVPRQLGGHTIPARSQVQILAGKITVHLAAPLPLPELHTALDPQSDPQFNPDGCLTSATPPDNHPLLVHGIALKYRLQWHYRAAPQHSCDHVDFLRGSLAHDQAHSSELTEGLEVRVSPETGAVVPVTVLDDDPSAATP